ncbi:MAG: TetR/AcrR family transcriptional regulator [Faecalibacterium sp.]
MGEKTDLRIQKTYLGLHNAFTALLEEKKFEDFTVNELCDRAMIRRATFYKHFADKYEYFTFYMKEIDLTFQDQLAPDVMDDEVDAYLLHMSRELLRFMKQHEKLVQNVKNSSMFPLLLNILLEQISEDVTLVLRRADRSKKDRSYIEGTAAFYAGGLINTVFQCLKRDEPLDEEQVLGIISKFPVSGT